MSTTKTPSKGFSLNAGLVILVCFIVAVLVYLFVFGNPSNFVDNDPTKHPKDGNYLGIIYKGGFIVPLLMTCFITTIVICIERYISISSARGTGSIENFVRKIKFALESNDVDSALKECDKQKGSVANVVRASLLKYKAMESDTSMDKDQKVIAIRKEIEESTGLELPMLEKNLVILSTLASVATLIGLLGTVVGMIRSFAALASSGSAGAEALATGISEALINTALGIGTSAIAIIAYNFFTTKIDALTYGIDEAGFCVSETFASKHK